MCGCVCVHVCQHFRGCVLGVLRYTGIDNNWDIQSIDYRYYVNLVFDDIPVLAIIAIF